MDAFVSHLPDAMPEPNQAYISKVAASLYSRYIWSSPTHLKPLRSLLSATAHFMGTCGTILHFPSTFLSFLTGTLYKFSCFADASVAQMAITAL
jgi:hypothetical protein